MTRRNVRVRITTVIDGNPNGCIPPELAEYANEEKYGCADEEDAEDTETEDTALSDDDGENEDPEEECTEMVTEGRLITTKNRVELIYEETAFCGMDGTVTKLGFMRVDPRFITLTRSEKFGASLVFEPKTRHICIQHTPVADFEMCVYTKEIDNRLLSDGFIFLEYFIEVQGSEVEHCRLTLELFPDENPL